MGGLHAHAELKERICCFQALLELAAYVLKMLCIIGRSPTLDEALGWEINLAIWSWHGYDLIDNTRIYYGSGSCTVLLRVCCLVALRTRQTNHATLAVYEDLLDIDLTNAEHAITPVDSHD